VIVAAAAAVLLPFSAFAAGPYTSGSTGFDESYPQCAAPLSGGSFAIIGVTGGHAFTQNGCFGAEYTAAAASGVQVSLYMNLNAAIGSTASQGLTGPKGSCKRSDKQCVAYNYGWNAAKAAIGYATASGASTATTWWLDIETANSWNADTSLNRTTIQGAVDGLKAGGGTNVGVYSTAFMWNSITGSWNTLFVPVWYASATCAAATGFTGGAVWLVQNASGAPGGDLAC
jgi:hypothetical protein